MSKKEKLLERLQARPKDFTWAEACRLMRQHGYELSNARRGSSRTFYNAERQHVVGLHEPHNRDFLLRYELDALIDALRTIGVLTQ